MSVRKYHWKRLESFCSSLFERAGVPAGDSHIIAESLVQADLRGVDSHGVVRADIYLRRLKAGMINTDGVMHVRSDGPVVLLDGNNHFGAVVGMKALELTLNTVKTDRKSVV